MVGGKDIAGLPQSAGGGHKGPCACDRETFKHTGARAGPLGGSRHDLDLLSLWQ